MRRIAAAVALAATLIVEARPAASCDQVCADPNSGSTGPAVVAPLLTADDADQGFYIVTKAWTTNTVTTDGSLTTYGFTTADVSTPTTVARDALVVQSGQRSALDSTASNGRPLLSDGRPVGGTFVDSYTLDQDGNKVFLTRTFLPDDSELAKDAAKAATITPPEVTPAEVPPAQIPAAEVTPPEVTPTAPTPTLDAPLNPVEPAPEPASSAPEGRDAPDLSPSDLAGTRPDVPLEPDRGPRDRADDPPTVPVPPSPPAARDVRAGVALGPQADVLSRMEILRGRRVRLWIRAFVDGAPSRVISWRLAAGDVSALGPVAGTGDEPFTAQWLTVGRPGDVFVLRFDAVVAVSGGDPRSAAADVAVTVRSPALVE